ncbi:MAG TPA: N-acetylglucosamine-6-phosphate deacetylase [Myxococcota bacterium]|nr:N-acetylglucosamine-6-phosphate deacetylase [Myxococcota bacterium]
MTRTALVGARILAGGAWKDDHALILDADRIDAVLPTTQVPAGTARHVLAGGTLLPGFIDTQVNGGGGVLLNDAPTVDGVRAIAAAHRRFGTTGLLPTLISDDLDKVAQAIAAVDAAIEAKVPGVLGIHLEGPFLNAQKRGIHDAAKFRRLDPDAVDLLASSRRGKTLVTLAPELCDAGLITALVERGVIVAAGHTLATYEQMQAAFAEGLRGVTHLFNAMTQLESRSPGVVGAALESATCISGIIADGHHVAPASLRVALRTRGPSGLMLVTDAMSSVGSSLTRFSLFGQTITVADGALRGPEGQLAGSHLDMAGAVRNAVTMMGVDLAVASRIASATPATLLGIGDTRGIIAPGRKADLVHLDDEQQVTATWIDGVR